MKKALFFLCMSTAHYFLLSVAFLRITPLNGSGWNCTEEALIEHVKHSIDLAEKGVSKLTPEILSLNGMSSPKVRHFLNNLCSIPGAHYLEIGAWKGSTWVSALYQNPLPDPVVIDNWSGFPEEVSIHDVFIQNCNRFLPNNSFMLVENDCFAIALNQISQRNIYFYDGEHGYDDQVKAFTYYNEILDDLFIAIVDDYDWVEVHTGTQDAFKRLQYQVLYEVWLPPGDVTGWHNGLYVAVVKKG